MGFKPSLPYLRIRRRRDVQPTIGGVLFILGGIVTGAGMAAPHAPETNVAGLLVVAAGMVAYGVALLVVPEGIGRRSPPLSVIAAVAACTAGLALNGERYGAPPMFNELFYFWPVLYVGYFFSWRRIAAALVLIAGSYAWALNYIGLAPETMTPRFVITMNSLVGAAVTMRLISRHVDGLLAKLSELARTDVLTSLLNRRAFEERLQDELDRAGRTGRPFALLVGDIDHFKAINDRFGHAAGDAALRWVAAMLTAGSRQIDTVARVGGEEFALLLPDTTREGGVEVAERLRLALKDPANPTPLTMSFGVVEAGRDGPGAETLKRAADRALYAAKDAGRDRTVTPGDAAGAAATDAACVS